MHRFDDTARMVLHHAKEEAIALGHVRIMPEHLLLGMLQQNHPIVKNLLEQGLSLKKARDGFEAFAGRREATTADPDLNQASLLSLEAATAEARRLQAEQITLGHLLLGILRQAEIAARQVSGSSAIPQMLGGFEGGLRGVMRRVLEHLRNPTSEQVAAVALPAVQQTITVVLEQAVHQKILEFAQSQSISFEVASQKILSDWAKR